jgi:hypothetical protein
MKHGLPADGAQARLNGEDLVSLLDPDVAVPATSSIRSDMIWIPGGTFRMGSDRHYPEEAPFHRVAVDGFWIDATPVTNSQFRAFVQRADSAEMFSGDRRATSAFANNGRDPARERPPDRRGAVPRQIPGNPATDFATLEIDVIDRQQALAWFHRILRTVPKRQVLVFIYGFNSRFDAAVSGFAQIVHCLSAQVVPILFTLTSRDSVLAYRYEPIRFRCGYSKG